MADTLFIVPVQIWFYAMVYNSASRLWMADRAGLLAGLMVESLNDWIINHLFGPAISDFTFISRGLLPTFFTIAILLLGLSYVLAPFFQIRVVHWQKALGWLLFALVFYQFGPGLYVEGERIRRAISSEFYGKVLEQANTAPTAGTGLGVLDDIAAGPDAAMGNLDNYFGPWVPTDNYVDGLDLAMAYMLSDGQDVVLSANTLPEDFSAQYFDPTQGPLFFLSMTPEERTNSINQGLTGISRFLLAWIIILFGLFEQSIYLCLSIAMGILFLSMSLAILFAFFERTELMARSIVDMWLELFILSIIISAIQAFVVGIVTLGARTLNPTLTLGASFIGAIVMLVLLLKAARAIWDAMNRLFGAMSQVVGGGLMSPLEAGIAGATAVGGLAVTVATAGAGAAVAAAAGASAWQVAGSALSGLDTLYNASAMGSFVLPDESPLKGAAGGFFEGALSNRMLGPLGGMMLGDNLSMTSSHAAGSKPTDGASGSPPAPAPTPASAPVEVSSIKTSIVDAINAAIQSAPKGGYANRQSALEAVRTSLGSAASDPRMGSYVERHAPTISSYVLTVSRAEQPLRASVDVNVTGTGGASGAKPETSSSGQGTKL